MSKLDGLKSKLQAFREKLARKGAAKAPKGAKKNASGDNLYTIYQEGNFRRRLQVVMVYVLTALFFYSATLLGKKVYQQIMQSRAQTNLRKQYAEQFDELKDKARDAASVVSIGKLLVNGYDPEEHKAMMSVDIWARCSTPEAAAFAQDNYIILHDKAIDAFSALAKKHVDFLTNDGKAAAKDAIRDAMNTAMKRGKIEEIFFQNLVIQ